MPREPQAPPPDDAPRDLAPTGEAPLAPGGGTLDPDAFVVPESSGEPAHAPLRLPRPTPRPLRETTEATPAVAAPGDETIVPDAPRTMAGATRGEVPLAAPHDATLDPADPKAQAYEQAIAQRAPVAHTSTFGDYQLIEPIAKGGMGIVYKARQKKLNRIVALKMILAGQFADRTDVERFYAEAEAAAALTHPNIVAIHEIGEVGGQHFFSMDYIEGQSLAALVRESTFTPKRAAEFLKTIAETMQYAHERGIVHRDLKPSNVLVDRNDRPLITDFGLAKQISSQSQLTMSGAIIGTPSYMPPEQAAGEGDRVGPWSDTYSLGAILYELVTGRPPFRAATPFETVRQVLESEPLSPRLVNPGVPKDLETICLKCLQKEPTKRYATSEELADELGRFLRGEPIQARPISKLARLWRLCRRNPVTASFVGLSALLLVVAVASLAVSYVRVSRALGQVAQSLQESETSLREAIHAVDDLFTSVSEETLLDQPGMQPLQKELLEKAQAYYQRFLEQRDDDPRVRDELANAMLRVGLIRRKLASHNEALLALEKARDAFQTLAAEDPANVGRLEALGTAQNALGALWLDQQDHAQALPYFIKAVEVRTQLTRQAPQNAEYQRVLANTYMNIGQAHFQLRDERAGAREAFTVAQTIRLQAVQLGSASDKLERDQALQAFNFGQLNWAQGRLADAEADFAAALAIAEKRLKQRPGSLEDQKLASVCQRALGDLLSESKPDAARRYYQQGSQRLRSLAQQNPEVASYQAEMAGLLMNLGLLETQSNHSPEAIAAYEEARRTLQALHEKDPASPRYRRDLAATLKALAFERGASGDPGAARDDFSAAQKLLEGLRQEFPAEAEHAEQLAGLLIDRGQMELEEKQAVAAVVAFQQAVAVRREIVVWHDQSDPDYRCDLAISLRLLGAAQAAAANNPEARTALSEAQQLLQPLVSEYPETDEYGAELKAVQNALLKLPE